MAFFDWLFGGGSGAQPAAQSASAVPAASAPPIPSYGDFYNNYLNAAKTQTNGRPGTLLGLWDILSGKSDEARVAAAKANAPLAYFQALQGQNAAQQGALSNGQDVAMLQRMHAMGLAPDPAKMLGPQGAAGLLDSGEGTTPAPAPAPPFPAAQAPTFPAVPAPTFPAVKTAQPQQQPQASGGGLPAPDASPQTLPPPAVDPAQAAAALKFVNSNVPTSTVAPPVPAPPAAGANPIQQRMGLFSTLAGSMVGLPKFTGMAQEYFKMSQMGVPADLGAVRGSDGRLYDSASGEALKGSITDLEARRAAKIAGGQAAAQMPYINAEATHKQMLENESTLVPIEGANGKTILVPRSVVRQSYASNRPIPGSAQDPATRAAIAGMPSGVAVSGYFDPETHKAQVNQVVKAQQEAADASQQQTQVQLLKQGLAGSPMTGPGAETMLNVMRVANTLGLLDPDTSQKVANGELANMQGVEVAGVLAKNISGGRTPLGIFNQVYKNKPQLLSSNPSLMLEAINQDLQRQQDRAAFVANYYQRSENATKLDAETAFDREHPISQYQSRILPLRIPSDLRQLKVGYTYDNGQGRAAVWNGVGWDVTQ
jgi:hypothetical protein